MAYVAQHDVSPEQNLTRYLQGIRKYPMLSVEDEQTLTIAWKEKGDEAAAAQVISSHLRLVAKIAMGYRGYGLPVGELISEGNVGMMQALNRFDPERGFRFSTYAMWWIKASIQEYILHSWSLVKMGTTASQKKLFFNLRKLKGQMQAFEEGDLAPETVTRIADRLQVSEDDVVSMNRRLSAPESSLNTVFGANGEGDEWQDLIADDSEDQEAILGKTQEMDHRRTILEGALRGLSVRERQIFNERRLKESPETLETLSQRFGISRERVRQIEVRAFQKVQKSVRNTQIDLQMAC